METNNHFNYGPHPVPTNSGLKHSSGESLFTNGSSMSFPQQGKNLNGDMNVNGITTADGASQSGPHPPSSSYPHMSNHHRQGSMGYDYLWGQSQYNPALSSGTNSGSGHGIHQKPGSQGVMQQQQPQHHFQGHGQYQVNGSMGGSRQPPVAGAQYWGRGNPGQQQEGSSLSMGYSSHGMYGGYPNQVHSGVPQTSHHQQPPPIQHQSATALHHHPHHPQHHQPQHQQQQQQHYGMVPNGMPFYQHQAQHAPLSSQQPQTQAQSQPQAPMMPTTQNFTPPRGSPQHPHMSHGGTNSPLPMQVPRMSPSSKSDSGSPQRKESPGKGSVAHSTGIQVHINESYKEVDQSYNGIEIASVPQRLSASEGFPVKPPVIPLVPANDYISRMQQVVVDPEPAKQHHDMGTMLKELSPPVASPSRQMSTALPQTVSGPTPIQSSYSTAVLESPQGLSTHASVVPKPGVSTSSSMAVPPQLLTTPPLMVQGPLVPHGAISVPSASASKSAAPQMGQSSKVPSPAVSTPAPVISRSQPVAVTPPVKCTGSMGPQVPQPLISQDTPHLVISTPSSVLAPPQSAKMCPLITPSSTHTAASLAHSTVENCSLPVDTTTLTVVSTAPPASVFSQMGSSQKFSAPPPAVSATPQASPSPPPGSTAPKASVSSAGSITPLEDAATKVVSSSSQSLGHMISLKAEQQAFGKPYVAQKTSSEPDVGHPHDKALLTGSVSKQECHADNQSVSLDKCYETSLNTPGSKEMERGFTPLVEKDPGTSKDRVTPGDRAGVNTLSDILDTGTSMNYPCLVESTYTDASRTEDIASMVESYDVSLNNTSQAERSSMFTDGAPTEESKDWLPEGSHREDNSCEDETMATRSSSEDASLQRNLQMDYSLNDTSQNDISQLSSSVYEFSIHSTKANEVEAKEKGHDAPELVCSVNHIIPTLSDTGVQGGNDVLDLGGGTNLPLSTAPRATAVKKPRKPKTPKASAPPDQSSPDAKKKRQRPALKVPKEENVEWKKTNEEKSLSETKKRKISKEATELSLVSDGPLPDGAPPLLLAVSGSITDDPNQPNNNEISVLKPKKFKKLKIKELMGQSLKSTKNEAGLEVNTHEGYEENNSTAGETPRRRIATEEQVNFPLLRGWKREIRVRTLEDRMKGETWYYSPCGRRMKQFPEVIKYLKKHQDNLNGVTREHFSFSPRIPVGDFYEERDTSEGKKWFLLANEEVPSIIMSITGRRGRPPNPDKEGRPRTRGRWPKGTPGRRPGRPPKAKMIDLLSKIDARLLKRLEAKEELTEEDKEKLIKIKKKMKKKARLKRREEAKIKKMKQEKLKAKLENAKEPMSEEQAQGQFPDTEMPQPASEPKKRGRRKKATAPAPVEEDLEKASPVKRAARARCKAKALAKAQAEMEAQAQAALAAKRQAERRAQAQKRLEERKRQQLILEELKKPAEDMCLTDHTPLPELSRIPGLVLSGVAFSHCITVVEFLHSYGKVLGLQVPKDIPSLATLQEGLLGTDNSQTEVLDLLVKLVEAALIDPGLPSYYQSVKILGEKLVDLELSHSTVSEVLRIFLECHGFELEVCNILRTKSFQTLCPDVKAAILAFLVDELNASNIVIREIDNTLENMTTYRKNKWIIEGKLRKLKAALARKTGRSEEELCFEERRRSARVGVAEEESLEENSLLERASRRRPKEEPKLSEAESPNNASIPELERQIDKLTKRQVFFRKKLLQSSHCMRAMSLGQDRYRRRYWLLPHIAGVLVEGPEEILASDDILVKDVPVAAVKREFVSPVKTEVKEEPPVSPVPIVTKIPLPYSPPTSHQLPPTSSSHPEVDPLPGEASLMSSPRGRGRPRKIKPEVELHLRAVKNRRRRRSSRSGGEDSVIGIRPDATVQDLTQSAFQMWLSQSQGSMTADTSVLPSGAGQGEDNSQPEDGMKELAEKRGQWFNLLPKEPCDETSLSQPCAPLSTSVSSTKDTPIPLITAPLPLSAAPLFGPLPQAVIPPPRVCSTPAPRPGRRRRRGSGAGRGHSRSGAAKRRGRPPSSLFQEMEQKYFTQLVVKPIPLAMVKGWWWIKEPEDLTAILSSLHPRGIREKVLHKHLTKHMEFLAEFCTRPATDPIFQQKEDGALLEATQKPWVAQELAMQIDISVLQWVEDLEQRVLGADLQLKMATPSGLSDTESAAESSAAGFQMYTPPEPDSTRDDLQYYEHEVDPRDDWIVKVKKEWSDLLRVPSNPLDLAVLRLTNLERNIERRYLKDPLWNLSEVVRLAPLTPPPGGEEMPVDAVRYLESEITPRLRTWRQALDRCRSASQLALCLLQLERAIAWEKSIVKVTCQMCRKGDNDECLLLCDGCDRGWHMFCLRPKVTEVPEGDWFCPTCISKGIGEGPRPQRSARQRSKARKRRFVYGAESSDDEDGHKRSMSTRQKDGPTPSSGTSQSLAKRRRMATRNQPDLTYCEIILMEMEAHADAWPFLEPVNPRLVPGYRRIIKNPMDFLTMRERLLQGGYCSCEEFAADAQLVFNNCELFNEDSSEVGKAGHSMRRFFESRWAEFYSNSDK
ncbi:bromodomain adjacent to zinc finger domain protein 2A isoform X3 [Pygocentrus nattereri]|uniref:bromodomain adjacent to zinc finger domain protein 2A isoform X3 n=1 Tax=Pygocentrus nattereri TaxID=42514 RepID=UPI0018918C72|nr:bromodomain adjacent to zinc finger domain protein 2A isoform X3 [Pygocentrus nattereri]